MKKIILSSVSSTSDSFDFISPFLYFSSTIFLATRSLSIARSSSSRASQRLHGNTYVSDPFPFFLSLLTSTLSTCQP